MINLKRIVLSFSDEEQRKFINYLEKKNKRKDAKNTALFKLLLDNDLNSKDIFNKLYKSKNIGAYHALRKRLNESIIDFKANIGLQEDNSVEMQIIKYILASKSFMSQKEFKVAFNILGRAEALAKANDLFTFLNEIYHTQIEYAHTAPSVNLDAIISKFKENQKSILIEEDLNLVYAKVRKALNSITYHGKVLDFETTVAKTLKDHNIKTDDYLSFKSLHQLISIVSFSAFISKDYLRIEPFLIQSYKTIISQKQHKKQRFYHIQILYAIANALFRNKKFNASLRYLKQMQNLMLLNKKQYFNTFKLKYNLLLSLNLNYKDQQEQAIKTLVPFINQKHNDIESLLDIHLSLIMFYFQGNDYKKAQNIFSKFYHTDTWYTKKAGKEWVIKKNLVEILLHIELNNVNLVESRLLSFKRLYYPYLKNIEQQRVITYIAFVEAYYKNPETVTSKPFHDKLERAFDWKETHKEDIFVMSFYSWLKSKMNKTSLYETTLKLIDEAK